MLADVFENFRNMCLKICERDPAKFLSAPGLAWPAALKNWYQYVINGRKRYKRRNAILFFDIKKLINTWKIMIKVKNCYIFNIGM